MTEPLFDFVWLLQSIVTMVFQLGLLVLIYKFINILKVRRLINGKNNKLPVIDIKGSDYVLVKDRVIELHRQNDDFSLTTEIISDDDTRVVMKTTIEIEERIFTGIASEFKSKECCYENCETSSVGRAIGFYGIGIVESIASADEMNKFHGSSSNQPPKPASKNKYT